MLITEHFVLLNYPKTGSTFARKAIKELQATRLRERSTIQKILQKTKLAQRPFCEELKLPNTRVKGVKRNPDQHGTYAQIPSRYRHLPVVSIVRNPYTHFLSAYQFRFWERNPPLSAQLLNEHFPHFPNLSLDDFVELVKLLVKHDILQGQEIASNVGNQTVQFIRFFFKEPDKVLRELTNEYLDSSQPLKDLADITFLRQENLNEDLVNFLKKFGYSDHELDFIRTKGRVNVTQTKTFDEKPLWTENAIQYITTKERLLFRILENKGISYAPPQTL